MFKKLRFPMIANTQWTATTLMARLVKLRGHPLRLGNGGGELLESEFPRPLGCGKVDG